MAKRNKMSQMPQVRNEQGIAVRVCCASCAFKRIKRTGLRVCRLKECAVKKCDTCEWWTMNYSLSQVGKR